MKPDGEVLKSKPRTKEIRAQEQEEQKIDKLLNVPMNHDEVLVVDKKSHDKFEDPSKANEKKTVPENTGKAKTANVKTNENPKRHRSTRNEL